MESMNAFEARKYLMSQAKSVMDEADDRMTYDEDPMTGEPWKGSKQLFYAKYKTILEFAKESNDPLPKIDMTQEVPEEEVESDLDRKLRLILKMMIEGDIDANSAEQMLKPTVAYMNAMERRRSQDKVSEVEDLIEAMRDMSDNLPV